VLEPGTVQFQQQTRNRSSTPVANKNIEKAAVRIAEEVKREPFKHRISEDSKQVLVEDTELGNGDEVSYSTLAEVSSAAVLDDHEAVVQTRDRRVSSKTAPPSEEVQTRDRRVSSKNNPPQKIEERRQSDRKRIIEPEPPSQTASSSSHSRNASITGDPSSSAKDSKLSSTSATESKEPTSTQSPKLVDANRLGTTSMDDQKKRMLDMLVRGKQTLLCLLSERMIFRSYLQEDQQVWNFPETVLLG
jgi:hypothetical protein